MIRHVKALFFIALAGLVSAVYTSCLANKGGKRGRQDDPKAELYKIQKIDSIRNVYLIFSEKNGKVIRIVSPKVPKTSCRTLTEGKTYTLTLAELFPSKISGVDVSPGSSLAVKKYTVFGIDFELGPGENVYRPLNVKGL